MFTGIIQDVGEIARAEQRGGDLRLEVRVQKLDLKRQAIGDSIAVSGVCLTVVAFGDRTFLADLSRETLALTTAGSWRTGERVNLEPALRAGDALGGHLVSGHVDGIGEILSGSSDGRSERFTLRAPAELARFIARKGSVALDGVSLTVNGVQGACFDVNLIPHTRQVTTLGAWRAGVRVNLEIDVIARYAERLMSVAS
ncbi:MAG TPA: riboflavin synthase [Steroidobacteraceae bacterium]|nr:riboflavin synthase [Steroidobacteraceae bacterium]